jgi:peptidoglycan DL-endopeptidase LytE
LPAKNDSKKAIRHGIRFSECCDWQENVYDVRVFFVAQLQSAPAFALRRNGTKHQNFAKAGECESGLDGPMRKRVEYLRAGQSPALMDARDIRFALKRTIASAICLTLLLVFPLYSKTPSKSNRSAHKTLSADSASKNAKEPVIYYVVKKGDSLFSIANSQGTTVKTIKTTNHLQTNRLQIGQKLSIQRSANAKKSAVSSHSAKADEAAPFEPQLPDSNKVQSIFASEPEAGPADAEVISAGEQESKPEGEEEDLSSQPLRYRLASAGLEWLGVRYRRSGYSEEKGFDCSGLVKRLFEKFEIGLPRCSREQYKEGVKVEKCELEVGDLVFFSSRGKVPNHVGIYIGDNMFLHAALRAKQVVISSLSAPWFQKRYLGARRLLDLWEDKPQPEDQDSK